MCSYEMEAFCEEIKREFIKVDSTDYENLNLLE